MSQHHIEHEHEDEELKTAKRLRDHLQSATSEGQAVNPLLESRHDAFPVHILTSMGTGAWLRQLASVSWKGSGIAAWVTIGTVLGHFLANLLPDTVGTDPNIAHGVGALFGAAATLGLLPPLFRRHRSHALQQCLEEAARLFQKGIINEAEWAELRNRCIQSGH